MPPHVLVTGQATVDRVHADGSEYSSQKTIRLGGKALNQAVAAARLGANSSIATAIGNDKYGHQIGALLKREGIDGACVVTAGSGRGPLISSVQVDLTEGRRQPRRVAVTSDPRLDQFFESAVQHVRRRRPPDALLLTFELPDAALEEMWGIAAEFREKNGSLVVVNPAPVREMSGRASAGLRNCDVLIPNRAEAEFLLERQPGKLGDAVKAARELRSIFGPAQVCITLGRDGAACADKDGSFLQSAFAIDPVDKVGASDVFVGALAVALRTTGNFRSGVKFAAVCAAIAVGREGGLEATPTIDEVDATLGANSDPNWADALEIARSIVGRRVGPARNSH